MLLTETELERWGRRIGAEIAVPVVITLSGPLGAGKSVLARAIARGAGSEGPIPSPTFNLLLRHRGREGMVVLHWDLYRLDDPSELWELGWEEIGEEGELTLVEWPERAGEHLPPDRWEISLEVPEPGSSLRLASVERVGEPPPLPGFPVTVSQGGDSAEPEDRE